MKPIISLKYILPVIIFMFFSFKSNYSQIEIDTSKMGPPSSNPSLDDFKDSLSKSGSWVKVTEDQIDPNTVDGEDSVALDEDVYPDYVWVPSPVYIYDGWSPYCNGQWVWTYWGWQWVPYYDYGWGWGCTYHYGRWWYSNYYGWCWSPGRHWRHSWVSWCNSGAYWGWHPLSPRVHYRGGVAVLPIRNNEKNDGWVFVNKKDFKQPIDNTKIVDVSRHNEILKSANQNLAMRNQRTKSIDPGNRVQQGNRNYNGQRNQNRNSTRINSNGPPANRKSSGNRSVYRGSHNSGNSGRVSGSRSSSRSSSSSSSRSSSHSGRR